jgi:hypothetical protein
MLMIEEPFGEHDNGLTVADVGVEFLVSEKRLMKLRRGSLKV